MKRTEKDNQLIRLNIAMSYPVKWDERKIMNNFVQNFYDALGAERFGERFRHRMEGTMLTLSADEGFAEDWLFYLGASSKRGGEGGYAGGFGEGFKIAALTALRDYHLSIELESRGWTLRVTSVPGMIAGEKTRFLAYEIGNRPFQEETVLRIGGVTEKFREELESVMTRFFYDGNRLLGECIVSAEDFAVYTAVQDSHAAGVLGCLFASYEKRGCIYVPLVICNHTYKPYEDDRDRDRFSKYQIRECINSVFEKLDPATSFTILEYFRKVWNGRDRRGYHAMDWRSTLHILIGNIAGSRKQTAGFYSRYGRQLIIRDTKRREPDRNKIAMALAWFRLMPTRNQYRFVIEDFRELGIQSVCSLCEAAGGFTAEREPDQTEYERIMILKKAAQETLGDLLLLDPWPRCRILVNPEAPVEGYTKVRTVRERRNIYGLKICARAEYVYLQAYLFQDRAFPMAFVTYAHELLHAYGGDNTGSFHRALFLMNTKILQKAESFQKYEREWDRRTHQNGHCDRLPRPLEL